MATAPYSPSAHCQPCPLWWGTQGRQQKLGPVPWLCCHLLPHVAKTGVRWRGRCIFDWYCCELGSGSLHLTCLKPKLVLLVRLSWMFSRPVCCPICHALTLDAAASLLAPYNFPFGLWFSGSPSTHSASIKLRWSRIIHHFPPGVETQSLSTASNDHPLASTSFTGERSSRSLDSLWATWCWSPALVPLLS